jgi:hypothetical protein
MAVRAGSDCVGDSVATAISKTLQAMYLQIRSAPSLRNGDAFPQHSQTPFAKSKTHETTSALRTYCEVIISVVRGFGFLLAENVFSFYGCWKHRFGMGLSVPNFGSQAG